MSPTKIRSRIEELSWSNVLIMAFVVIPLFFIIGYLICYVVYGAYLSLLWTIETSFTNVGFFDYLFILFIVIVGGTLQLTWFKFGAMAPHRIIILALLPVYWVLHNLVAGFLLLVSVVFEFERLMGWLTVGDLLGIITTIAIYPLLFSAGLIAGLVESCNPAIESMCTTVSTLTTKIGLSFTDVFELAYSSYEYLVENEIFQGSAKEYAAGKFSRPIYDITFVGSSSTGYYVFLTGYTISCVF